MTKTLHLLPFSLVLSAALTATRDERMREAAAELIAVANAGDEAAFGPAFGKLGGTCKACHDSYRIPEE